MKTNVRRTALAAVMMLAAGQMTAQNKVRVMVENVPSDSGMVLVSTSCQRYAKVPAHKGTTEVVLEDMPVGPCTIYVMHDSNNDRNPNMKDGVPEEYVWQEKVNVEKDGQEVRIGLKYIPDLMKKSQNK